MEAFHDAAATIHAAELAQAKGEWDISSVPLPGDDTEAAKKLEAARELAKALYERLREALANGDLLVLPTLPGIIPSLE